MPNDDDGQDHMVRFIPLKEVDRSATFERLQTLLVFELEGGTWNADKYRFQHSNLEKCELSESLPKCFKIVLVFPISARSIAIFAWH